MFSMTFLNVFGKGYMVATDQGGIIAAGPLQHVAERQEAEKGFDRRSAPSV